MSLFPLPSPSLITVSFTSLRRRGRALNKRKKGRALLVIIFCMFVCGEKEREKGLCKVEEPFEEEMELREMGREGLRWNPVRRRRRRGVKKEKEGREGEG